MTVCTFATNNLVRDHDIYEYFMGKRERALSKDLEIYHGTPVLFYRKGLFNCSDSNKATTYRAINRWHCISLAVTVWDTIASQNIKHDAGCKKIIYASREDIIKFKERYEGAVNAAKIHKYDGQINCCRYLAMYWTYLDIIKDTTTSRFYPDNDTIEIAAEVFGYPDGDNPFVMNGKYYNYNTEEQPVEEKTEVNDDILATQIRDLNLTIRTFNCLWRAGIKTLGDICMKSQRQLLKVRNLGRNSLNEIKDKLADYDYYYMDLDSNAQKAHPKEESVADICEQVAEEIQEKPEMKPIVSIDEYDELYTKYNDIQIGLSSMSQRYEKLFKEKTDLQQELLKAKDHVASLESTIRKLTMAQATEDDDIFGLITNTVRMMKVKKMPYISLQLDGYEINIKLLETQEKRCNIPYSSGSGIIRDYSRNIYTNTKEE